jgi:flagellar L-ring protein FlgH
MINKVVLAIILLSLVGCSGFFEPKQRVIPSMDYSTSIKQENNDSSLVTANNTQDTNTENYLRFVSESGDLSEFKKYQQSRSPLGSENNSYSFLGYQNSSRIDSFQPNDSPSLWREAQNKGGLFQDFRAWKPMDLITIIVREITEGRKEADTNVIRTNSFEAAMAKFLGIETTLGDRNTQLSPASLIDVSTSNSYQGEGETVRRGSLTGTISGMVVEVLPSGILRVEGKKIISVNDEEQVMVISGLIRTRDINSSNEVDSSKVANMRIDYFGKGMVTDSQSPGIFTRILMKLWPF